MLIIKQKFIFREDIRNNRHLLYIFGDNLKRVGFGGQAKEMRGEPNSFGIATKRAPTYFEEDFFNDKDYNELREIIKKEFENLYEHLENFEYEGIVIPSDGIGTGIAKLQENAPKLLAYINRQLDHLGIFCRTKYNY